MSVQIFEVAVCKHCDNQCGCNYPKTHNNVQPKFKPEYGGRDAVRITPGIIMAQHVWCGPHQFTETSEQLIGLQKAMCAGFEAGGTLYLLPDDYALIDNSKH